jgi:lambda repressor-like predicted transcriptional regulator
MIEQEQVNAVVEALERAKQQPPVKSYATQKEAVEAMRDHIADLHKRGWSIAAIAKVITDAGIKTSPGVVSSVLKPRTRRARRKVASPQSEPLST